jgi:transcriptional regulator with XRE-family HTH domain
MGSVSVKSGLVQKEHLGIGETIRHFRKKQGLTLQQLADMAGLSPSFISLAERGKATPSIVSLMNLAKSLDISISNFLEIPKGGKAIRRKDQPEYLKIDSPVEYVRLSSGLPGQKLDAMLITIPAELECPKVRRDGESFYYVLEGYVRIVIDDEEHNLGPGDSAHFSTRHQYRISCEKGKQATLLWTGTPALFADVPRGGR